MSEQDKGLCEPPECLPDDDDSSGRYYRFDPCSGQQGATLYLLVPDDSDPNEIFSAKCENATSSDMGPVIKYNNICYSRNSFNIIKPTQEELQGAIIINSLPDNRFLNCGDCSSKWYKASKCPCDSNDPHPVGIWVRENLIDGDLLSMQGMSLMSGIVEEESNIKQSKIGKGWNVSYIWVDTEKNGKDIGKNVHFEFSGGYGLKSKISSKNGTKFLSNCGDEFNTTFSLSEGDNILRIEILSCKDGGQGVKWWWKIK